MSLDGWLNTARVFPPICVVPMRKELEPEVPPEAAGFATVTLATPAKVICAAGTVACNCVLETNVVASAAELNCTTELLRKFVPFTVIVKLGPSAITPLGLSEVIVGVCAVGVGVGAGVGTTTGTGGVIAIGSRKFPETRMI